MLLKRPQTGITAWSFFAKKGHDNSLEIIGQRDTCSNNLEKPSNELCKLLYAAPLWIFQYYLLQAPWRGRLSRTKWWIKSTRTIHLMASVQLLLYMVICTGTTPQAAELDSWSKMQHVRNQDTGHCRRYVRIPVDVSFETWTITLLFSYSNQTKPVLKNLSTQ